MKAAISGPNTPGGPPMQWNGPGRALDVPIWKLIPPLERAAKMLPGTPKYLP
ncbi:hypothetical protein SISNIDRAFT_490915 [Sistotremastrum niveocremeum HHB9708]|uniref:Uncharacterized protein n=1 Tax=Sistotremastrum niveocremeum HHB9708 TaxID=1314777 RepID=A0A164NBU7_9AGAM|nr:hypothetical protein SISNIDRAFT_490915 [Sistotremastrum niveocremeum HHB9708]